MPCDQKSPGPADFKLKPLIGFKDHDINSKKARGPEWTMAERTKMLKQGKTPGPIDIGPFNRFGKFPSVGGVMLQKYNIPKKSAMPGPANYNSVPISFYKWPYGSKFTMGVKTKLKSLNIGPGPASEITPVDIYKTRAPKYPMFSKIKGFKLSQGPGPSEYGNKAGDEKTKTLQSAPAYTMREKFSRKHARGPGPANYNLMDYNPFSRSPTHRIASKPKKPACVGVYVLPEDNC